jgi:hypothetical protein
VGTILQAAWELLNDVISHHPVGECDKAGSDHDLLRRQESQPQEVERSQHRPPEWEGPLAKVRKIWKKRGSAGGGDPLSTYNGSPFLREQLDSLLNQTYGNWSLTIRDDGSTDDTVEIIRDYQARFPEKITLIEGLDRRLGPCQSYARLLERAMANYIMS